MDYLELLLHFITTVNYDIKERRNWILSSITLDRMSGIIAALGIRGYTHNNLIGCKLLNMLRDFIAQ